jgi:hypothetical protein
MGRAACRAHRARLRRHADLSVGIYEPKRVIQIKYEAKSARLGKNHRSHVESLRHRILAGVRYRGRPRTNSKSAPSQAGASGGESSTSPAASDTSAVASSTIGVAAIIRASRAASSASSGGSRANTGGAREGAGRPDDSIEVMPRDASLIARKWRYAEKALARRRDDRAIGQSCA